MDFAVGRKFRVNTMCGVPPLALLSEGSEACSPPSPVFPGLESCFQAQQTLSWTCFFWPFAPSPRPPHPPVLRYILWILFPLKGNSHRTWPPSSIGPVIPSSAQSLHLWANTGLELSPHQSSRSEVAAMLVKAFRCVSGAMYPSWLE